MIGVKGSDAMNVGWIKLSRELEFSPLFQNAELLRLYLWLVFRSAYTPHDAVVGKQKVSLAEGQLICGVNLLTSQLGFKRTTAQRNLKLLQEWGVIDIDPRHNFSVVTVKMGFEWFSERPLSGTNKKDKKEKKDKSYTRKRSGFFNFSEVGEDYSNVPLRVRRKISE
jgi:hypothetical protein